MRKIILSMNVTLDGFMSGPDRELDWHFSYWSSEMSQYAGEQLNRADTILLGRITHDAMAAYWPLAALNVLYPRDDIAFADMMNSHAKIIFSRTVKESAWINSRLTKRYTRRKILQLKQQPGKDMILYGSNSLVSNLLQWGLIDEYILWIHPVILGKGIPLFKNVRGKFNLKLLHIKTFMSGVVVINYEARLPGTGS